MAKRKAPAADSGSADGKPHTRGEEEEEELADVDRAEEWDPDDELLRRMAELGAPWSVRSLLPQGADSREWFMSNLATGARVRLRLRDDGNFDRRTLTPHVRALVADYHRCVSEVEQGCSESVVEWARNNLSNPPEPKKQRPNTVSVTRLPLETSG